MTTVFSINDEGDLIPRMVTLVNRYRELKTQADAIKAEMDKMKHLIAPIVDEEGNWKDDKGYARRITRNDSISYSGDIDGVAHAWANSSDPVIKSCGDTVLTHRKVRRGSSYIQIK